MNPPASAHSALGAQRRRWLRLAASLPLMAAASAPAHAAEWEAAWNRLLGRHVAWDASGVASTVDYRGVAGERAELGKVLAGMSAVSPDSFAGWPRNERLAFLVNAYNAFTIELILTRYPDLKSIRDLGSLLQSAWKKPFFELFGRACTLDTIEHEMIRKPGAYDDPRIHVAVVCASIGCPALRPEAFTGATLDAQFDDSLRRFLTDRRRNRYEGGKLLVSRIFDWYRADFEKGFLGIRSRETLFARYADLLADDPAARAAIRSGTVPLAFLDYDWSLNDRR